MALASGTRVGGYTVTAALGAGGMGEVYRARDERLEREVALKVLPVAMASDPERLARFRREAKLLASLNHPNIAHLYGFEDGDGRHALVMELVEGTTLGERVGAGALPVDEALDVARQICDALEYAHEQGIIHRDLKPANIKVRADGTVKVLDFGLAKALAVESTSAGGDWMSSPTLTSPATMVGAILGTAAYMSPEQARGRPVDRRADIWAFGAVLYEMLTGRRAFEGDDVSITLASVLKENVRWEALPAATPEPVRRLLRRCLEKDPKRRLSSIADARLDLDEPEPAMAVDATVPRARHGYGRVISGALILAAVGVTWWAKPAPMRKPLVARFVVPLAPELTVSAGASYYRQIAVSPDGSQIVIVANGRLYLRRLDDLQARPIAGSEGALEPVFSPDGQWIAYYTQAPPELRKLALTGGAPVVLCPADNPSGLAWRNGIIAFAPQGRGILAVSENGGIPRPLVRFDEKLGQAMDPDLLADGRHVVFGLGSGPTGSDVAVATIGDPRPPRVLVRGGGSPRVLPEGQVIYVQGGTLFAMPFDRKRLTVSGTAVAMGTAVAVNARGWQFDVSGSGTLAYVPGSAMSEQRTLVWVDRQGHEAPLGAEPRGYEYPRISPDGTHIAVNAQDGQRDIWVWNIAQRTLERLTFGPGAQMYPAWTPDSRSILFSSGQSSVDQLATIERQAADGTGTPTALLAEGRGGFPQSISPDGKWLVFRSQVPHVLSLLALAGQANDPGSRTLLHSPGFNNLNGEISPDGRWIAYESDETGASEVYVRPFPAVDTGRWQISSGGGTQPAWARNGRELYFLAQVNLMAAAVRPGAGFNAAPAVKLFNASGYVNEAGPGREYDVAADGRFLFVKSLEAGGGLPQELVVETNWAATVAARLAAGH